MDTINKLTNSDFLNLYIHIPFCEKKCYYCHFFTFAGKLHKSPLYFKALNKEILYWAEKSKNYKLKTIYIGGGTPSLPDAEHIVELVENIKANFTLDKEIEITIEVNPESVTSEKLEKYLSCGIRRISMGLQAWQDELLEKIGRTYDSKKFTESFEFIKKSGFSNINIDTIFGLPGQTYDNWKETIDKLIGFDPNHISCYSLELDNDSKWGKMYERGLFSATSEELDRHMYRYVIDELQKASYERYEISNFCKPGMESWHNLSFWSYMPYIGIGAAAHSYFEGKRFNNVHSVEDYIASLMKDEYQIENEEIINKNEEMFEWIMLRLRLRNGVDLSEFKDRFGSSIQEILSSKLDKLVENQLVDLSDKNMTLTGKGIDLYNQVFMEIMDLKNSS